MSRDHLEQNAFPEQFNLPRNNELASLLTDIHATQEQLGQHSGTDVLGLQDQLAAVKAEVVQLQEDTEIIWKRNELERLKQRVQTIRQQIDKTVATPDIWSDPQDELLAAAQQGRLREAQSVYEDIKDPQSGIGRLDRTLQRFGDRV